MVVMDPQTGRVLAMVGGFSYDQSQFNRATQGLRQPGSSFKPLVYAAAIDNGYTPSSVVLDAPIEVNTGAGGAVWRPENYGGKFYGPSTLRFGLEHSRNVMVTPTVRGSARCRLKGQLPSAALERLSGLQHTFAGELR